jgi:hypothetical protein
LSATFFELFFFTGFFFCIFGYFQTMPKWFRNLVFNAVRTYSYIRRAICRAMDQLAAMLARSAMPAGMAPNGPGAMDGAAAPVPQVGGSADDIPDREVCGFFFIFILLADVLLSEYQPL